MTKRGLLIVLSGPSGVGKDTILHRFLEQRSEDCVLSVSATTREPRPGEVDGKDYFFLSREKFGELAASGEMLEYAQYGGNLYGTPRAAVDAQLEAGRHVILEIEVQGAMQIKTLRPDAVFVFIMPPSWECLESRLSNRGTETPESLQRRLAHARTEMTYANKYDYVLVNDEISRCAHQFSAVVDAAQCANHNMREFIEEVISNA